jgi:hypothetical protein
VPSVPRFSPQVRQRPDSICLAFLFASAVRHFEHCFVWPVRSPPQFGHTPATFLFEWYSRSRCKHSLQRVLLGLSVRSRLHFGQSPATISFSWRSRFFCWQLEHRTSFVSRAFRHTVHLPEFRRSSFFRCCRKRQLLQVDPPRSAALPHVTQRPITFAASRSLCF